MTTLEDGRPVHPRHGTHDPTSGSPARRPGSIRRTTTIDMVRHDPTGDPLLLIGRGRDLVTAADGSTTVVDAATVDVSVNFAAGRVIDTITTQPQRTALDKLVGARVASGFRRQLDDVDPDLQRSGSVLYQILDDLPGAALVSGHALITAIGGIMGTMSREHAAVDLCAGWATDATIMLEIDSTGTVPGVLGPAAPLLPDPADPLSWHAMAAELPLHAMRRARRIDVWRVDDGSFGVDGVFRDSYVEADGVETALHEYALVATVDAETWRAIDATATPHALPWVECPRAAASAGRIAGLELADLRTTVRQEFTGISTCTHLNDQLRSLSDVPSLAAKLPDR